MYCKQCGHDVQPGTRICPFCGSEIPFDPEESIKQEIKYCPLCGTSVVRGAKFCTNCGNQLDKVIDGENIYSGTSNEYTPTYNYTSNARAQNSYRAQQRQKGKTPGILSIIFGFLIPEVGFILGIIAIIEGIIYKNKSALVLGIIGTVISVAMWTFNHFVLSPAINKWLEDFWKEQDPNEDYIFVDGITNIFSR